MYSEVVFISENGQCSMKYVNKSQLLLQVYDQIKNKMVGDVLIKIDKHKHQNISHTVSLASSPLTTEILTFPADVADGGLLSPCPGWNPRPGPGLLGPGLLGASEIKLLNLFPLSKFSVSFQ